jgi:Cof subfamily protein (haloacid dehalogenase superfamily)
MLFAFDLDKTLVTNDYQMPKEISEVIRRLPQAGHAVTVLTGRPLVASLAFLEQLGLSEYYATNHGALVIGKAGAVLQHKRIVAQQVAQLIEPYAHEHEVEYSCIVDDTLYVKNPDDARWAWAHTLNRQIKRYHPDLELSADKVVFSANGLTPAIRSYVQATFPGFVMYPWDDGYLEITAADADKGTGLALLASELGFRREDTIAFGDGPNDVTMLAWAGKGVAVGPHAHADVLAVADEHIPSPEELGIVSWLERHVL